MGSHHDDVGSTRADATVAAWLEDLGLGQYRPAFAANDIDASLLPTLTADDLRDLGITSVGHRRRLLEAIARLRGTPESPAPAASAERRHVTVMFSDIVGSSALAARLDPEEMREVIRQYQDACAATVSRFDGTIARFVGDGILCYFGYPSAHEDDAGRAVRCALAIVRAIAARTPAHGEPIAVRIGVASGLVVIGDIVGASSHEHQAIVGETPNLAARLQAVAAPNEVIVADSTRRLSGDAIEFAAAGEHEFKGVPGPVRVFRAVGEADASRVMPRPRRVVVGRTEELARLEALRAGALGGSGHLVAVIGDPGIGKTTLLDEVAARATADDMAVITMRCSPYHADTPLHPVIAALRAHAGFVRNEALDARRAKLEALLGDLTRDDVVVADLLGVAAPSPAPSGEPPRDRRERALRFLRDIVFAIARPRGLLLRVEDLHWSDPSTLELIATMRPDLDRARVLVLATHRPEFTWAAATIRIVLARLTADECAELVRSRLGAHAVSAATVARIVARGDGVPLFVEHLAEALGAEGPRAEGPDEASVPDTLHGVLAARLDRLGPAKEVAQTAATIGRTFSHDVLAAVWEGHPDAPAPALRQLVDAGILTSTGGRDYEFHHALIRDAAYAMLLHSRRRALHGRIAECLERLDPDTAVEQPEVLARHLTEAGRHREALGFWRAAGRRATARWADVEAAGHYRHALAAMDSLAEGAIDADEAFDLAVETLRPLVAAAGYTSPDVRAVTERAATLGARVQDPRRLFPMLFQQWIGMVTAGELDAAHGLGLRFGELARGTGGDVERLIALRMVGSTQMFRGEFVAARRSLDAFMEGFDRARWGTALRQFGTTEHQVTVGCCLAALGAICGEPETASRWRDWACAEARRVGHAHSLGHALGFGLCFTAATQREDDTLAAAAKDLLVLANDADLPFWRALAEFYQACADVAREPARAQRAIAVLERMTASGARGLFGTLAIMLADAATRAGDVGSAAAALGVVEGAEQWFDAEALRVRAVIAGAGGRPADARTLARQALALARGQGARLFESRALVELRALAD